MSLSDGSLTSSYTFTITVSNTAPIFSSSLAAQSVGWTKSVTYALPSYSDPEGNTVTLTTVEQGQSTLPSFVTFDSATSTYTINPTSSALIGTTITISVTLSDTVLSSTYTFTITVPANTAPTIGTQTPTNQVVHVNSMVSYTLPTATDAESNPITTTFTCSPLCSFITLATDIMKMYFYPTLTT